MDTKEFNRAEDRGAWSGYQELFCQGSLVKFAVGFLKSQLSWSQDRLDIDILLLCLTADV